MSNIVPLYFMLLVFPITWITEKLNALPDNARIFHNQNDYWLMLMILLIVSSIGVWRSTMEDYKKEEETILNHPCPVCDGTGIEKVLPYPFEEFPDDADIQVRLAKSMVNLFYKWKNKKIDDSGSKYVAEDHIDSLSRAVTILEQKGVLTPKQIGV